MTRNSTWNSEADDIGLNVLKQDLSIAQESSISYYAVYASPSGVTVRSINYSSTSLSWITVRLSKTGFYKKRPSNRERFFGLQEMDTQK